MLANGIPYIRRAWLPSRTSFHPAHQRGKGPLLFVESFASWLFIQLLREVLGEHTCDKRSSRTWIHEHYPDWPIEDGFTESDELWLPDHRETHAEIVSRLERFLTDIFKSDKNTFLSLTSHSGAIAAILAATNHRPFRLETGGVIPIFVKAQF